MTAVIIEALRPLATSVANLTTDPDNARRGDVAAVQRSLNVFGQRKPIVVKRTGADAHGRPTGIVIAGNHTLLAALELGWDEIAAIFTDDDPTTARAYALADNRTGELATWDFPQLAANLGDLQSAEFELESLGWAEHELEALLSATWKPPAAAGDLERDYTTPHKHSIAVADDAWPIVSQALAEARERAGDSGLTDEEALIYVCRKFLAEP